MVNDMTIQNKIMIYNTLTVIFAILTFVSIGSFGSLPAYNVAMNTTLCAIITKNCYEKENHLRKILKMRKAKKAAKPQLAVFKQQAVRTAA